MALWAPVVDGQIQQSTSSQSLSNSIKKKPGSTLDKDAFLQLLVAQMKYQDPLEPTSNTEYISQLATFSELEEMQNVAASSDKSRAQALVGKQVLMKVISETTGETNYKAGFVEAVVIENGKTYLQIEGEYYDLDNLDSVYDSDYLDACEKALIFQAKVEKLPRTNMITVDNEEAVKELRELYDKMSDYEKGFISKEDYKKLQDAEEAIKKLKGEEDGDGNAGGEDTEEPGGSEGSGETDGGTDAGGTGDGAGGTA